MSTLSQASREWATRPDDQRFTSLTQLHAYCESLRQRSKSGVISQRDITALPCSDNSGLRVTGRTGNPFQLTNWSFSQLAQKAGAPAGYLRTLPSPMAADCINYGLKHNGNEAEDVGVLLTRTEESVQLRAVTGPAYGRVYNSTITQALVERFGDGITGPFRVPGEFGKRIDVTKANTTLYASDRDMFVFLADEERRIQVPNRRDGQTGSLARGFFIWNSDVGAGTLGGCQFLFDYACANRTVWGVQDFGEIRVRHTKSAPHRWIEEVAPRIVAFSQASAAPIETMLKAAQAKRVVDLDKFLADRYTKSQAAGIKLAHMADEGRPMESLWDVSVGVTAYARSIPYQDARVDLERSAGKVLALAA